MTVREFSLEFNVLYDNIASSGAPGINEYEKSVYLTKAQLEIIKQYNTVQNKYQASFDGSEKRRIDLKELIKDFKTSTIIDNANKLDSNSKFFEIPSDVFLIKLEKGYVTSTDCGKQEIKIIPTTLDEYTEKKLNPFRTFNNKRAFRFDFNSIDVDNKNVVEIVTTANNFEYHIRYIKYPDPIILTQLDAGEFVGLNLSIDGQVDVSPCSLNQEIHREILDRAVELAILDYKANTLQSKVEINSRNN